MLHLSHNGTVLMAVPEGGTVQLPNGDMVMPATDGWSNSEGYALTAVPAAPPPTPEEALGMERSLMRLSFSQFVVGLAEQGWITEVEAGAWLSANALPAAVEAALSSLPETTEDGSKPRLRARARALRPTEIERTNELLLMMAAMQGASAEQLDQFFRIYAGV